MVMILKPYGLAYFPIPKVANTSVKAAIREIVPETDIIDTGNKRMSDKLRAMTEGLHRIAVVREPVERGLSGWANRVIHERDVDRSWASKTALKPFGLGPFPDADTFFLNLGKYMAVNDRVRRHLLPQASYLGDDLSFFHDVYRIDEMDRLAADLSARLGKPVVFGRHQTGGPKIKFADLSPAAAEKLNQHFEADYRLLAKFYSPKPLPPNSIPKDSERPAA
jgi:hypothetical protein